MCIEGGIPVTCCDSCFRLKPTGEDGWVQDPTGIPATTARVPLNARPAKDGYETRTVAVKPQPLDTCPDCAGLNMNPLRHHLSR